jgi:hypothetical protein
MSSLKESPIHQLPTFLLQEKFNEEQERVMTKLMKYYPRTNESLEAMLYDLKVLHEELQRRKNDT